MGAGPGARITLRAGRDKPFRQKHPWIFSGAVERLGRDLEDGAIGEVETADGERLGHAYVNRRSQILARAVSFVPGERVDERFFEERVARAVNLRGPAPARRLVHAESDALPGLIVDQYGDFCVLASSTLGIDRHKPALLDAVVSAASPRGVFERSDGDGRDREGLAPVTGRLFGEEPPELLEMEERTHDGRTVTLPVDVRRGHKTGAYLDQADNRRHAGKHAHGADVLNLFSYTGGFALHAAAAGARSVLNVDSSADALALSERAARKNGFEGRIHHERDDAFEALRRLREEGRSFDGIVVDPPKFAHSAGQVDRAARAYKDLFRLALLLTRPGGWVALFSCSGAVSIDLFQKIAWSASLEADREARIALRLGQPADHPVLLSFPEGEYLKGLFCRVP